MFDKTIKKYKKYKDYRNAGIIDKDKFYLDNFLIIWNFEKEFKDLDIFSASFDEIDNLFYIVGEKKMIMFFVSMFIEKFVIFVTFLHIVKLIFV